MSVLRIDAVAAVRPNVQARILDAGSRLIVCGA
jgi:hypothetical protein